jgi:AraC-like DNA-binding protein
VNDSLIYRSAKPDQSLEHLVDKFWTLQNPSENGFEGVIMPDGNIDLLFIKSEHGKFQIQLTGLETKPKINIPSKNSQLLSISFKPLAVEYILHSPIADILNGMKVLPLDFWDFDTSYFDHFDVFCAYATEQIKSFLPIKIDHRKCKLLELLDITKGSMPVNELSDSTAWSARQINRYFKHHFGLGLKAYCNILRFSTSVQHIKNGILSPKENYFDQAHFIKEVKKLSGVSPRELSKNQNDRFLQLSVLPFK